MGFDVRDKVRKRYGEIAAKVNKGGGRQSCCGGGKSCSCGSAISDANRMYGSEELAALPDTAVDASLGCANPLVFAELKPGETALDLGSGGGIDVLMASRHVGEAGKVYGLDMTDEMLKLANANKAKMGVKNVEFLKGFIEDIPLPDGAVDVVMSNCVINLSDDKPKALKEAYRVLKPGGRLAVADITAIKPYPDSLKQQADLWCSCISGALPVDEYRRFLEQAGFKNITIEPAQVYTRDVIASDILGKNKKLAKYKKQLDEFDGVFASSLIKAYK